MALIPETVLRIIGMFAPGHMMTLNRSFYRGFRKQMVARKMESIFSRKISEGSCACCGSKRMALVDLTVNKTTILSHYCSHCELAWGSRLNNYVSL